jgi:hypothetical protein
VAHDQATPLSLIGICTELDGRIDLIMETNSRS